MGENAKKTGVLLLNLGTPRSPEVGDVRRYLREFLSDPLVIDTSALTRWLLVNTIIAPFRAPRSAAQYRTIWSEGGSPLLIHGRQLQAALAQALGDDFVVELGMRYGEPTIDAALGRLARAEPVRLIVLPLFPQYATSSTGSAIARMTELLPAHPGLPAPDVIEDFYAAPGFIAALAAATGPALAAFRPDHLLMSYHGLPERQIRKLDASDAHCLVRPDCCEKIGNVNRRCYKAQCHATSRALAAQLGLADGEWSLAFQSRLGRTPWIQPFTDHVLPELAARGVKRVAVVCPSFVADCLETLEEIGVRAREQWEKLGGEALASIPCVNATPVWVTAVEDMVRSRLS